MIKFTVAIEETAVEEFEVTANDAEEALKAVQEKYKKGECVLNPGEVQFKQVRITKPESEMTEWSKF